MEAPILRSIIIKFRHRMKWAECPLDDVLVE